MKITEITVSGGAKWNHPHEEYSNLHTELSYRVELEPGEDPEQVTAKLQEQVALSVWAEKQRILQVLQGLRNIEGVDRVQELKQAKAEGRVVFADVGPRTLIVKPGERAYIVREEPETPF